MGSKYAYVDGAFLRERSLAIERLFGFRPELEIDNMRSGLSAARLFYYDCVEDKPRPGETLNEFEHRTQAQTDLVTSVSQAALCHVRPGTLKRKLMSRSRSICLRCCQSQHHVGSTGHG